ncbi:MAG: chromosome partitioning protein ParB [Planctomycetota bacterium]
MSESIELSTLNARYEGYRLRDDAGEARVLASMAERGIETPLEGVDTSEARFLLNGFKRRRCAKKLGIGTVPYVSLAEEEASGIIALMRIAPNKSLQILEQAKFVVELLTIHGMSVGDVAESLSRSKGWVCMRRNLMDEMSEATERILFRGTFPVYSYMYTLRPFMRMNSMKTCEVERFIEVVAGQRLSVRDIELLADGYFRGPESPRAAIAEGKLNWSLDQMKNVPDDLDGCSDFERVLLKEFRSLQQSMRRVVLKCQDRRLESRPFYAQANLLTAGLLSNLDTFKERMKAFHDRSGQM